MWVGGSYGLTTLFLISAFHCSSGSRERRALFSTGKLLSPALIKPKAVVGFVKYPAGSGESLLRTFRKAEDVGSPHKAQPRQTDTATKPEVQIGGSINDAWGDSPQPLETNGLDNDEDTGPPRPNPPIPFPPVDGDGVEAADQTGPAMRPEPEPKPQRPKSCSRVPDMAAESLCKDIEADLAEDQTEEFLWVPLQTPLVGYDINTRLERWYQRGCFVWKQKQCEGTPRFPLDSKCRFWAPEPSEGPGCPIIDKRVRVDWKTLPPNKCPCKWPCTETFATIQECYQTPSLGAVAADRKRAAEEASSITLSSGTAFQLCRAVKRGGSGPTFSFGWIPIRLRLGKETGAGDCFVYTYTPCEGSKEGEAECGKWFKEKRACDTRPPLARPAKVMNDLAACPCDLPCIRFFDPINKCRGLEGQAQGGRGDSGRAQDPVPLLMKDALLKGTTSSLIECNFYEGAVFCTVIPEQAEQAVSSRGLGQSGGSRPPPGKPGRVKCEIPGGKPLCHYVFK